MKTFISLYKKIKLRRKRFYTFIQFLTKKKNQCFRKKSAPNFFSPGRDLAAVVELFRPRNLFEHSDIFLRTSRTFSARKRLRSDEESGWSPERLFSILKPESESEPESSWLDGLCSDGDELLADLGLDDGLRVAVGQDLDELSLEGLVELVLDGLVGVVVARQLVVATLGEDDRQTTLQELGDFGDDGVSLRWSHGCCCCCCSRWKLGTWTCSLGDRFVNDFSGALPPSIYSRPPPCTLRSPPPLPLSESPASLSFSVSLSWRNPKHSNGRSHARR